MSCEFVFMLTHNDQTVENCLEWAATALDAGVHHIGFKDIGVSEDVVDQLVRQLHDAGARTYLEVVSTRSDDCRIAAKRARELGINVLLGGVDAKVMLNELGSAPVDFMPFAGRPVGHPTRLHGDADAIARDCSDLEALGCAGIDLLAWRAVDDDPRALVRAARAATTGTLLVAGSINSTERIREVVDDGADAFTIGSAIIDASIAPHLASPSARLGMVLKTVEDAQASR